MKYRRSMVIAAGLAVIFVVAAVLTGVAFGPVVTMQSASQIPGSNPGQDGTTNAAIPTTAATASFSQSEEVDMAGIEASPTVPDDSQITSNGAATYTIATPLPGGVDHIANGTGTRNLGTGTIRLRGAPTGSVVVRAYLYWGQIISASSPPVTDTATFNGTKVTGNLIGSCPPPCWPGTFFVAYQASVIALMNAGINGDYAISVPTGANSKGQDPWETATPANPLSEGASLVVVYSHSSISTTAAVYFNQSAQMFFGPIVIDNGLFPGLPSYTILKHTRLGADGQVGASTFSSTPISTEKTYIGPDTSHLTQIRGPGGTDPDSDWNGNDGGPLNQLWDTHSDSLTSELLAAGATDYKVKYVAQGDCIVAIVHILGVK